MSQPDRSTNESEGTLAENSEEALVRPRYEQSHPAKSQGDSGSNLHPKMQHEDDLSHAPTTITDSGESVYTYDSMRDLAAYFHEVDGRKFSTNSAPYGLPADETEFWRLDKQHTAFLIALADLYPCPDLVERALAPRPGETIEMMDLGCGTGTWALSMAKRFPHAQVLGIDVAPNPLNPELLTPNIEFEVEDINMGLTRFTSRFDLVHMRCVGGGLLDYAQAITNAAQCLKPKGILIVADLDLMLCDEDMVSSQKMATPSQPNGSWFQRFGYEFRWAYALNGTDVFGADKMFDKGLWDHPLLDACGAAGLHIPLGPWPKSKEPEEAQRLEFSGILLRQNIKTVLRSCQILMKKAGIPQEFLDECVPNCEKELDSLNKHSWMHLRLLWGQRNGASLGTGNEESSSETNSASLDLKETTWVPHKQIHLYQSAEECEKARKKRWDTLGEMPKPLALAPK